MIQLAVSEEDEERDAGSTNAFRGRMRKVCNAGTPDVKVKYPSLTE